MVSSRKQVTDKLTQDTVPGTKGVQRPLLGLNSVETYDQHYFYFLYQDWNWVRRPCMPYFGESWAHLPGMRSTAGNILDLLNVVSSEVPTLGQIFQTE